MGGLQVLQFRLIGFGLLGYIMRRLKYDSAPLVLALVLGPMMERSFREAMMISKGDLTVFVTRPISATLLTVGLLVMALAPLLAAFRPKSAGAPKPA